MVWIQFLKAILVVNSVNSEWEKKQFAAGNLDLVAMERCLMSKLSDFFSGMNYVGGTMYQTHIISIFIRSWWIVWDNMSEMTRLFTERSYFELNCSKSTNLLKFHHWVCQTSQVISGKWVIPFIPGFYTSIGHRQY